jgi:hypothetical protein
MVEINCVPIYWYELVTDVSVGFTARYSEMQLFAHYITHPNNRRQNHVYRVVLRDGHRENLYSFRSLDGKSRSQSEGYANEWLETFTTFSEPWSDTKLR